MASDLRARLAAAAPPALLPVVLAVMLAACSSAKPAPEPESEVRREATATARAAAETPPPARAASTAVREKLVVVEEGGGGAAAPADLAAAARAARAERQRPDTGEPGGEPVRITNDNLAAMAAGGKVTFAGPKAGAALAGANDGEPGTDGDSSAADGTAEAEETAAAAEVRDEAYWRNRSRELRRDWHDTLEEMAQLEDEIADLRWRFYAEDDPWVRDGQIKPAWDRALDRLRSYRAAAAGFRQRVDELVEEGRRAGALPGWLREGIELEPETPDEEAGRNPAEPAEPVVVDETRREPRR